jgi:hypothetical protein
MAAIPEMKWVVLDTSYLLEMYRVPGKYDSAAHEAILLKAAAHVSTGGRIYVPAQVIFEFANHIAAVTDGAARRALAHKLKSAVESSLRARTPWIIIPLRPIEVLEELTNALLALCGAFAEEYAVQGIGLTDVTIIDAANHLATVAARYPPPAKIHIWTRDGALKAREPNAEHDSFV